MNRVILIKYGELSTKKGNRNFFIKTLYENVKSKLKNYDVKISKDRARMYIEFLDTDLENIKNVINKVFGIHMYHIASIVDTNIDSIKDAVLKIMQNEDFKTFKVETKRSDKAFEVHSQDMNRVLGGVILKNIAHSKVDVHNPDILVTVEIRENNTYVYLNSYKGSGGYPVGTQPKGMLMLSGGIDSPVAGYLAMKRGVKFDAEIQFFKGNYKDALDISLKSTAVVDEDIYKKIMYGSKITFWILDILVIVQIYKNRYLIIRIKL